VTSPTNPLACAYAHRDGAYVLGALSATERLEFEQHLAGCEECSRSVREMAGLPGLLSRVDRAVLEGPSEEVPLPDSVLPHLVREVRRTHRRRLRVAGGLAAAAVATVVALAATGVLSGRDPEPPARAPQAAPEARVMTPVGNVPVKAKLALEPVTWGTRLDLACTYASAWGTGELPHRVTYSIYVLTRDGHDEQVGTWSSLDGRTMRITAATAAPRAEISSVEVRTSDGRPVLQLSG
jgi:hypothetical protein